MKLDVLNIQGEKTGRTVELPEDVFGIEPNEHAVYLAVKSYLAHQRQGTHKAKERGEIAGSTRKIKRQKGTGTARAGSLKNPLFRKGGRVFGPRPRKYVVKLNKKVARLARRSALTAKATAGSIVVVENFSFDAPQTSTFKGILKSINAEGRSLVVTADLEKNVYVSSRNLDKTNVVNAKDLNTYQVVNANTLVLSEGSIAKIVETFG